MTMTQFGISENNGFSEIADMSPFADENDCDVLKSVNQG